MTLTEQLVERAKSYCERNDVVLSTLSRKVFGDGKIFPKLEKGEGSITVERYESAVRKLDELDAKSIGEAAA